MCSRLTIVCTSSLCFTFQTWGLAGLQSQTCRNKNLFPYLPKDSPRNLLLKEFLFHQLCWDTKNHKVMEKLLSCGSIWKLAQGKTGAAWVLLLLIPWIITVGDRSSKPHAANDGRRKTGTFGWFWTQPLGKRHRSPLQSQLLKADHLEALKQRQDSFTSCFCNTMQHFLRKG